MESVLTYPDDEPAVLALAEALPDLECTICHGLSCQPTSLRHPPGGPDCGSVFCRACLDGFLAHHRHRVPVPSHVACPVCRTGCYGVIAPERLAEDLVARLPVRCASCAWTGTHAEAGGPAHRVCPRRTIEALRRDHPAPPSTAAGGYACHCRPAAACRWSAWMAALLERADGAEAEAYAAEVLRAGVPDFAREAFRRAPERMFAVLSRPEVLAAVDDATLLGLQRAYAPCAPFGRFVWHYLVQRAFAPDAVRRVSPWGLLAMADVLRDAAPRVAADDAPAVRFLLERLVDGTLPWGAWAPPDAALDGLAEAELARLALCGGRDAGPGAADADGVPTPLYPRVLGRWRHEYRPGGTAGGDAEGWTREAFAMTRARTVASGGRPAAIAAWFAGDAFRGLSAGARRAAIGAWMRVDTDPAVQRDALAPVVAEHLAALRPRLTPFLACILNLRLAAEDARAGARVHGHDPVAGVAWTVLLVRTLAAADRREVGAGEHWPASLARCILLLTDAAWRGPEGDAASAAAAARWRFETVRYALVWMPAGEPLAPLLHQWFNQRAADPANAGGVGGE